MFLNLILLERVRARFLLREFAPFLVIIQLREKCVSEVLVITYLLFVRMESRARASPEQFAALLEFMESHGDITRPQTLMKLYWILFHLILYKQHHQHLPLLLHCHLPLANFDALYHQRHRRHLALHPRRCHQRCLLPRPSRGGLRSGDDIGQAHRLRRRHPPPHQ
ncbi:unnamed protein product [Arctia plantaginis]|uniref:Uncharacterized protein n=1 Tax=Arctia plantaginis TaxID=874455 RepID=A0A8S0YU37_ARCPL|nr:unnamed protein product [Arctia plantaginis]